jgi:hypothetical protein
VSRHRCLINSSEEVYGIALGLLKETFVDILRWKDGDVQGLGRCFTVRAERYGQSA